MSAAAVHPAERYDHCHDLWSVTCIFNPGGFRSKLDNYHRFAEPFRAARLPLLTVECALGDEPFSLPVAADVVHVRSRSALWHKERLLNIAVSHLPPEAKKVAWVDGDVLFADPAWARATSALLETVPVVQPYQRWHRLPKGSTFYDGDGASGDSFAWRTAQDPRTAWNERHGLTGFAWAARRELLDRHGLYDACVIGGADQVMAHAFNGSLGCFGVRRILGLAPADKERRLGRWWRHTREVLPRHRHNPFASHLRRWATGVRQDVRGPIGCVSGHLLHLWHGSAQDRRYAERHGNLRSLGFDPATDLCRNGDGTWEWSPARSDLRQWAEAYFRGRREDD